MRRLLHYVGGVAAALAVLECAFRLFEPELAASASRTAAKTALLEKQGPVDVLFFGTSRFWDAIAPRSFAAAFPGTRAFNLAVSAAKLETLEEAGARFAGRRGLRIAFIEVSRPQLDPAPPPEPPASGLEAFAARHSKLIAHRAALRGESLLRLPELLLYPRRMDGSEVTFADQLASVLGTARTAPVRLDVLPAPMQPSSAPPGALAARMDAVGEELRDAGAQVVFVLPPILPCEEPEDVTPVAASLSAHFPVWDYRAPPLPASAWRDCSHLNHLGRALFTDALARQAARNFADTMRNSPPPQVRAELRIVSP